MSSVASHVNAASGFASARQSQSAGTAHDNDSDPFAAVFDAVTSAQGTGTNSGAGQPDIKAAAATAKASPSETSTATNAQRGEKTKQPSDAETAQSSGQTAGQSSESTTDAASSTSSTSDAAPSTEDHVFAATATDNLIQAAAGKATGAGRKSNSGPADASATGGNGKSSATSIAAKLNSLLAANAHGAANDGNAAATASSQTPASANPPASPDSNNKVVTTVTPGGTDVAGIIAAVKAALAVPKAQTTASSDTTDETAGTTASSGSKDDGSDTQSSDAPSDATVLTLMQPAAQPVATAITVNSQVSVPPTAGNSSAADGSIGDVTKSRTKLAMAFGGGKSDAPAQTLNNVGAGKDSPISGKSAPKTGSQAGAANSSSAQEADSSDAQQGGPAADAAATAQLPGSIPTATGTQPQPHAETLTTPLTSDSSGPTTGQTTSVNAKFDGSALPAFGVTAAGGTTPSQTAAAVTATNTSNTVPVAGLAVAIASRAQAGSTQFDIRLDPPELGRIEVRLGVDRDGNVTSHVTVDRADTLQLLQDQQPQLQQALDQAGLKTADNGLQFSLRDQSFAGQQNNGGNGGTYQQASQIIIPDADLPTVQAAQIYNRLGSSTGVDISV